MPSLEYPNNNFDNLMIKSSHTQLSFNVYAFLLIPKNFSLISFSWSSSIQSLIVHFFLFCSKQSCLVYLWIFFHYICHPFCPFRSLFLCTSDLISTIKALLSKLFSWRVNMSLITNDRSFERVSSLRFIVGFSHWSDQSSSLLFSTLPLLLIHHHSEVCMCVKCPLPSYHLLVWMNSQ